ncbi:MULTISPECIES: fimbrial protein [Klebsiella]|uniref:fimbrial protein n=1 Tax=Klebsiella TaxID=570 RepID=UPI00272F8A9A|nr:MULTISPECIES: fimbrial protein [Klebsiella]MDP1292919.1 fimbrial protein [Klebsiella variicola]MDP1339885.1 fimbrial protein [Klebsiella variicola]
MKLKAIVFLVGSTLMSGSAFAADAGHGKVTFKGSIIDAPCSISPQSIDQTVDLGQISNVALVDGGKSTPRTFDIALENCDISSVTSGVQLTFSGAAASFDTDKKTLGIVGTGAGAGVQITNGSGEVMTLGKPSPFQNIQNGSNTLRFSAYLVGNGGALDTITVGEFSSVADFTLSYL